MTGQQQHIANAQQSYTTCPDPSGLASPTSQRKDQSLPKSMPAPTQEKIQNIFSYPSKKIKTPDTQTTMTKTQKLNNDNGLQGRWTRTPAATYTQAGVSCFVGQESGKFEAQFFVESSVIKIPACV